MEDGCEMGVEGSGGLRQDVEEDHLCDGVVCRLSHVAAICLRGGSVGGRWVLGRTGDRADGRTVGCAMD